MSERELPRCVFLGHDGPLGAVSREGKVREGGQTPEGVEAEEDYSNNLKDELAYVIMAVTCELDSMVESSHKCRNHEVII